VTVTATYNSDIGRVQISFTGFSAVVDSAKIERSIDGINWSVIRGGDVVAVTSGAGAIDDFEFVPGVVNTYRVSGVDTALPSFNSVGVASTGNNISLSPADPSGLVDGDLKLIIASHPTPQPQPSRNLQSLAHSESNLNPSLKLSSKS